MPDRCLAAAISQSDVASQKQQSCIMAPPGNFVQLEGLQTELRNSNSADIDHLSTSELCALLNREDSTIHHAVESCIPVIADVIDAVSKRVRNGGRLFYIGAGTSGR